VALVRRLRQAGVTHRLAALLVALASALLISASLAHAEVPVTDPNFADVAAFLRSIGATDDNVAALASVATVPTNVEFTSPFELPGAPPQPPEIDPALTTTSELDIPDIAELTANGGPLSPGEQVFYGQGQTAPSGSDWYMFSVTMQAPCKTGNFVFEAGILGFDSTPLNGGPAVRYQAANQPTYIFDGVNFAYVAHSDPNKPFVDRRYQLVDPKAAQPFQLTETNWIGICDNNTIIGLIPGDEWSGVTDYRIFGYWFPNLSSGQPDPQHASQMRWPGITLDPIPVSSLPPIVIGQQAPIPTPTLLPTPPPTLLAAPTAAPVANSSEVPESTALVSVQASGAAENTSPPVAPTTPPGAGTTTTSGGGIDPLLLLVLAGLGLILLALWLFWTSSRRKDCDELGRIATVARAACENAQKKAADANAAHDKAVADIAAARAYEDGARRDLSTAQDALARAKARAAAKPDPSGYVEGDPYGRITTDDLALQNDANAQVRADADAAKAAARSAWEAAGSPQGDGAARLDDELSAIEKNAQTQMAHNNDPASLPGLRKRAGDQAAADMNRLEADVARAQQSVDDAVAGVRNASETESATASTATSAAADADRICAEAARAQQAYDECVGQQSSTAQVPSSVPPDPPAKSGEGGPDGHNNPPTPAQTARSQRPDRACSDGDEQWQPMGQPKTLTVRADGPKTRVVLWTDQAIPGLVQWMGELPDQGTTGGHASMSVVELDQISAAMIVNWLRGLGGSSGKAAPNMDFHFAIDVKLRTVRCEQRWVCVNGQWQARETRGTTTDGPVTSAPLDESDVTPSIQKLEGFIGRARRMVDALKKAEADAEKAKSCG
jgi:hypothetical protein